jgi:hypothetical protein
MGSFKSLDLPITDALLKDNVKKIVQRFCPE